MIILVLTSLDQSRTSLGPVAIETSCNQSFAVFSPVASKISRPKTSSVQLPPKCGKRLDWTGLLNTTYTTSRRASPLPASNAKVIKRKPYTITYLTAPDMTEIDTSFKKNWVATHYQLHTSSPRKPPNRHYSDTSTVPNACMQHSVTFPPLRRMMTEKQYYSRTTSCSTRPLTCDMPYASLFLHELCHSRWYSNSWLSLTDPDHHRSQNNWHRPRWPTPKVSVQKKLLKKRRDADEENIKTSDCPPRCKATWAPIILTPQKGSGNTTSRLSYHCAHHPIPPMDPSYMPTATPPSPSVPSGEQPRKVTGGDMEVVPLISLLVLSYHYWSTGMCSYRNTRRNETYPLTSLPITPRQHD